MISGEGGSEVERRSGENGNIGIFICSWEECSREDRLSVQQREETG